MPPVARRAVSLATVLAVPLLCVPLAAARASVIVTAGAPNAHVVGGAEVFDPPDFEESDSYDLDSTGTDFLDGFTSGSVSDSISLAGGDVTSDASASYLMTLTFDGPSATGGSISFTADASILLGSGVASDLDDYAFTHADADTITFIDFDVTDLDVILSLSGSLLDETLGLDGNADVFFFLADVTGGGFSFLIFPESDASGDDTPSLFDHELLLAAGGTYRIGLGASLEKMCAETPEGGGRCPGDVEAALIFGPDDFGVSQSAAASLDFTFTPVPEPGSLWLVGAGLAALGTRRRQRVVRKAH